jgi:hypothetical protein
MVDRGLGNAGNIIMWSYRTSQSTISMYRNRVCLQYQTMGVEE